MRKQAARPIPLISLKSKEKKLNIRPDFQRNEVWKRYTKQMLVDSILRDYAIPEIYFKESNEKGIEFEVIDGQQRLLTIFQFMRDEFKLRKGTIINDQDLSGLRYSQLPEEFKEQFDNYVLNYIAVSGTDEEIEEMFRRFQAGEKIRNVEARNSRSGKVRDAKKYLLTHPFFVEICDPKNNIHMQYDEIIEQMMLLEMKGIQDIKNKNIEELYEEYNEEGIPKERVAKIESILDYMVVALKGLNLTGVLRKTSIIGLYLVLAEYVDNDLEKENAKQFGEWFVNFENERKKDERNEVYQQYNYYSKSGTGSKESLEIRKDILTRAWRQYMTN